MEDSRGGGGRRKKVLESEDLQEDEVWAMMKAREGSNSNSTKKLVRGPSSSAWRVSATPKSIRRATANSGGRQEFSAATEPAAHRQSSRSGPVNIPDRSKILKKKSKRNLWDDACDTHNDDDDDDEYRKVDEVIDDDDNDDDEYEMALPHEYLARKLANTRIASRSMCEGVGRTLKGRDLSKTRNDILTKTGFIE